MYTFSNRRRRRRRKKKKHNERIIKDRIIRDISTLFKQEQEDYYEPKKVSNFWNNNCIEYERNCDKNGNLSLDEHLNKIKRYLRNIIIDLQNSDAWKVHLTIAINFISSKVGEEERLRKIIQKLLLIFCVPKKKNYVHLISQKLNRIVKNK